jgi:3-oxoacyl-[acyl-carrier protein] reductase
MANELGSFGITVNNVLPGATETQRLDNIIRLHAEKAGTEREQVAMRMQKDIPAGRFGTAAEIANVAVFLATPAAAYVNGVSIPVDGGRTGSL